MSVILRCVVSEWLEVTEHVADVELLHVRHRNVN